jgi:hypothetical protein
MSVSEIRDLSLCRPTRIALRCIRAALARDCNTPPCHKTPRTVDKGMKHSANRQSFKQNIVANVLIV